MSGRRSSSPVARGLFALIAVVAIGCSGSRPATNPPVASASVVTPVRDTAMEAFVQDLVNRMTLEEKLGQLTQYSWEFATGPTAEPPGSAQARYRNLVREGKVGSFFNIFGVQWTRELQRLAVEESRLKIPLIFGFDVIHGYRTIFPVPLAEAAAFDPVLAERTSRIAATEASAVGLHWVFSPMVDVARDARWGRITEGSGEDPYLGSVLAAARVRGYQGTDLTAPTSVLACTKHYAAYGASESGRDYNTVELSERTLRQYFLPPYQATVKAGVGSFMSSFNDIGGDPASGSRFLQTDVLRGEWGFDGMVVSDWTSVAELLNHRVVATRAEAGVLALTAGVDMDMVSAIYPELGPEVQSGRLGTAVVDEAVRRVLRTKYRLGLFRDPYRGLSEERERTDLLTEQNRQAARESARASMVLLKNDAGVLPLRKDLGTLAVIGPFAENQQDMMGSWIGRGEAPDVVTPLQGIRNAVSAATRVVYAHGSDFDGTDRSGFDEAVAAVRSADAAVLLVGERGEWTGEAASRSDVVLPAIQAELARAVLDAGKPVVVVLISGRPLAIQDLAGRTSTLLEAWFPGTMAGPALADVLFGDYNPSGKLPVTFPRVTGQLPYYYNHRATGRPADDSQKYTSRYIDVASSPLFPFGHGLSYTTFEYSNLQVSPATVRLADSATVRVQVRNTGSLAGHEVVQLYVTDPVASVAPAVIELKGFQKVFLNPGEAKTVTFRMPVGILAFYGLDVRRILEPGRIDVKVGSSSSDIRQTGTLTVAGPVTEVPRASVFTTASSVQ